MSIFRIKVSRPNSGFSFAGSTANTSSAAPRIRPSFSATSSASSSMLPPRAVSVMSPAAEVTSAATVSGLAAWYVSYVAFRNLKGYLPFVNERLWDTERAVARSLA